MIKYFLWIYFLGIVSSKANTYCDLCKNHTMCEFKGQSPTCGEHVESGITESEAEEIVFLHNLYRSKIANGSVICGSPGPQPPAANMNALTWDEDLAKVAQRWADQCNFDHDQCRRDARFQVGQNMYVNIGPATVNWRQAIKSWYSAVLKFNKSTVDNFQSNVNTNSYTQLVWANTRYIGCGRTFFETTSNSQENSLKYDKFISSTINGLKNRATNKESNTDGAKITRQKRDYVEYFGEASMNKDAANGALAPYNPINVVWEIPTGQHYHSGHQYGAEEPDYDEETESVPLWNPVQQTERLFDYPQDTQYESYADISNTPCHELNRQQQSVQPQYIPRYLNQPANMRSNILRSSDPIPMELHDALGETLLRKLAEKYADENDSKFKKRQIFIPRLGIVKYYDGKTSRVGRSVNSENLSNYDDDDDIAHESKEIAEKKSSQDTTTTRKQILVCNYGPTGNVIDQPIYIKGKLCSECPPNTTCKNGLCSYN